MAQSGANDTGNSKDQGLAIHRDRVNVQKHLPSNVARFEQLMYLSLGLALVETVLEWNRILADAHGSVRLAGLVTLCFYA